LPNAGPVVAYAAHQKRAMRPRYRRLTGNDAACAPSSAPPACAVDDLDEMAASLLLFEQPGASVRERLQDARSGGERELMVDLAEELSARRLATPPRQRSPQSWSLAYSGEPARQPAPRMITLRAAIA
jgi:hypothetical protein